MPWKQDRKMGAVAPTLFGAIKLLVNNQTAISEAHSISEIAAAVKGSEIEGPIATHSTCDAPLPQCHC